MVKWMQIMAEVRRLDDKRKCGDGLSQEEAAGLLTMLLDFHHQAVDKVPEPSGPSLNLTGQGSGG